MPILRRAGISVIPKPATTATPALFQHVSQSANPVDLGAGNYGPNFNQMPPNNSGAGNCIVLDLLYPNGRTPTISDNLDTWSSTPVVTADNGPGNYVASTFVLLNATSGQRTINVNFGAATDIVPFQATITEYNNIATASAVDGTQHATGQTGSSLTVGAFTPTTNNDANGGHLIHCYFACAAKAADNTQVSDWTPGGSFTLLSGNTAYQAFRGVQTDPVPTASMYFVQTSNASINPGITAGSQTTTQYNNLAVALKVARAGTAKPTSGIWINKVLWFTGWQAVTALKMKIPCVGNFRVLVAANQNTVVPYTGCTDNSGGPSWTYSTNGSGSGPQMFYVAGAGGNTDTPNSALLATVACSNIDAPTTFAFYDFSGVNASSPIGATAFTGVVSIPGTTSSTQTNAPNITPTQVGSCILAVGPVAKGPVLSLQSPTPAAAFFDPVEYDAQSDVSMMCNSDLYAHYTTPSLTAVNWTWFINPNPTIATNDMEPGAWEILHA